jgi:antitoxin component of MazEF toxin-antitoxin module
MAEYTLKIAGKRQVTLPPEVMKTLKLEKGDELQIVVKNPSDIRIIPFTRVRKDLITPEIQEILEQRRRRIEGGEKMESLENVLKKASRKSAARKAAFAGLEAAAASDGQALAG